MFKGLLFVVILSSVFLYGCPGNTGSPTEPVTPMEFSNEEKVIKRIEEEGVHKLKGLELTDGIDVLGIIGLATLPYSWNGIAHNGNFQIQDEALLGEKLMARWELSRYQDKIPKEGTTFFIWLTPYRDGQIVNVDIITSLDGSREITVVDNFASPNYDKMDVIILITADSENKILWGGGWEGIDIDSKE